MIGRRYTLHPCTSLLLIGGLISVTPPAGAGASAADTHTTRSQPTFTVPFSPARVLLISDQAMSLIYPNRPIESLPAQAGLFKLQSDTDPAYREPRAASKRGVDRQTINVDESGYTQNETRLHLLFDRPLRPNGLYRLIGPDQHTIAQIKMSQKRINPSLQTNQVGYLICSPKHAYVGNWLGDLGPMPVEKTRFQILDAHTGRIVHRGKLALRSAYDRWSGNHVYDADFSALKKPGVYRLGIPGYGVSQDFALGHDVFDSVYKTTGRLFYHSRNGTLITRPWADPGHERATGGIPADMDARFHPVVSTSKLRNRERGGLYQSVSGGWFDAGDYGQYIPNAAPVWYAASLGMDLAPLRFRDKDFNIPESGNRIPDLIDELEWGMDWALSMQDATDGGVWFRLASAQWDEGLPAHVMRPRYLFEKTSHATASFAAMAAIHARLLRSYRQDHSALVLRAAEMAWDFLETHPQWPAEGESYRNPPGVAAGEYSDTSNKDNRLWAAAELYRSTGKAKYHKAFKALFDQVKFDPTNPVSYRQLGMAALWAYLKTDKKNTDPELRKKAEAKILAGADWLKNMAIKHPFRAAMHHHIPFTGWGSFAQSTRAVLPLLQAYQLTRKPSYLDWAMQMANPQLGANPQSRSYITGIGANPPQHPLSKLSKYDNTDAPLRGIPVNGPHFSLPNSWASTRAVNQAYYPPNRHKNKRDSKDISGLYPALRRYTDAYPLPPMSEPTIADYAVATVAYGLLSSKLTRRCDARSD